MQFNGFKFFRLIFLCLILFSSKIFSQKVGVKFDTYGYVDNREYTAPLTEDKTFLGLILSPHVYFEIDKNHRFYTGIHFKQEFGVHQENPNRVLPLAYYQYKDSLFDFALGFIPRYEKINKMPRILLSDTLNYNRSNLQGMYFNYKTERFQQTIFIDWLKKQSQNFREQFIVGTTGRFRFFKSFYFQNDALLYHNAFSFKHLPSEYLQDNGAFLLRLGVDFSNKTIFNKLSLDAGGVIGFNRFRGLTSMEFSKGFLSTFHLGFKKVYLINTLYLGQAVYLPLGDSFYKRRFYNRLDFGWTIFNTKNLEATLRSSFHFSPANFDNQQMFILRYKFDKVLWK